MSNEVDVEDAEEKQLREQIERLSEAEKEKAENENSPHPEPVEVPATEPESQKPQDAQDESKPEVKAEGKDDPMEWAKKKGFKTPEDMARALLQKEQEFHQSRQKAEREAPPPPPAWQPAPQMGYQQQYQQPAYQPMPQRVSMRDIAARYPQLDPNDVERVLPLIMDAAEVISNKRAADLEAKYGHIERTTQRNNELMTLMQDPAFRDERVQKEVHAILDSDPTIFQRERTPLVYAFKEAVFNMGRKQLQTGVGAESTPNKPPVTAGGGNGSAFTIPRKVTERDFDSWSEKEQDAFIKSNGRVLPKR